MTARSEPSRRSWFRRGMSVSIEPPPSLARPFLALKLLVSRRPGLFLLANAFVLLVTFLSAATGGGSPRDNWSSLVLLPTLLLGIPVASDVVALERRSGSLDLALASPGASTIFERRLAPLLILLAAQSAVITLISWLSNDRTFALVPALVQVVLTCLLLGSATLFWAVRLRTPGAVGLATAATFMLLAKWALAPPMPDPPVRGALFPPRDELLGFVATAAVLLGASAVLHLHARRRLDRPEMLLR